MLEVEILSNGVSGTIHSWRWESNGIRKLSEKINLVVTVPMGLLLTLAVLRYRRIMRQVTPF
jgi:hypothetical protein